MQMNTLSHYTITSQYLWGKHRGKTVDQVIAQDPYYIDWCLIHHEEFVIADDALADIATVHSGFQLSELADFARRLKISGRHTFKPFNSHAWADLVILKAFQENE